MAGARTCVCCHPSKMDRLVINALVQINSIWQLTDALVLLIAQQVSLIFERFVNFFLNFIVSLNTD